MGNARVSSLTCPFMGKARVSSLTCPSIGKTRVSSLTCPYIGKARPLQGTVVEWPKQAHLGNIAIYKHEQRRTVM